jgi:hypothetical protein
VRSALRRIEARGFGRLLEIPGLPPRSLGNNVGDTTIEYDESEAHDERTGTEPQ